MKKLSEAIIKETVKLLDKKSLKQIHKYLMEKHTEDERFDILLECENLWEKVSFKEKLLYLLSNFFQEKRDLSTLSATHAYHLLDGWDKIRNTISLLFMQLQLQGITTYRQMLNVRLQVIRELEFWNAMNSEEQNAIINFIDYLDAGNDYILDIPEKN